MRVSRAAQVSNIMTSAHPVCSKSGLFKEEFSGDGVVVLNSKTYYCWRKQDANKHSSKGLSMITNTLSKGHFTSMAMVKKFISRKKRKLCQKRQNVQDLQVGKS